jgi:hypothetical protein
LERSLAAVLVIEKNGFQVFLRSLTPLMRPYIVKMTGLVPKCLVHRGFYFYLVPSECGDKISHLRHTVGEKCYIAQKLYIMTLFLKNLNTYN